MKPQFLAGLILIVAMAGGCMSRPEATVAVATSSPPVVRYTMSNLSDSSWSNAPNPTSLEVLQIFDLQTSIQVTANQSASFQHLSRFGNLRTLSISGDAMNDRALGHILNLPRLEAVVFYNCDLSNAGVQQLSQLPNLKTVGFYESGVTETGADRLRSNLPTANIEVFRTNTTGKIFDGNGCYTSKFANDHL